MKKFLSYIKINKINIILFVLCFLLSYYFLNYQMDLLSIIDLKVSNALLHNEILNNIMNIITNFGSAICLVSLSIAVLLFIKNKNIGLWISINLAFTFLINTLLKFTFLRERPSNMLIEEPWGPSFPSAHTMCSVSFYLILVFFVNKYVTNKVLKRFLIVSLYLLAIGICYSRVYFNVHYFSDIIGGVAFGIICMKIIINIFEMEVKK